MEVAKRQLVVVLLVVVALFEGSRAVSVCDISEDGLAACKPSVTKPDPVEPPSVDCCKAVSGANFTCLCSYKNSYLLPYLGIDPDLAMALPSKHEKPFQTEEGTVKLWIKLSCLWKLYVRLFIFMEEIRSLSTVTVWWVSFVV
ncbi:hypothetical protein POTOM_011142 [Populus tomentosa]|uniref:Bifunctional inhibitor/plant lipid transfer protein/seed storage helical domain-containing protein n=1 Tax=Populus tomentosa TaxID=118781 RepID=A0A8X8AEV2_POPTO|nr:hypothetical protein POTOM_011142 [Populus tomentosa]